MPDRRSWGESRGSRNLFRLPPEASVSLSIRSEAVRKHRPLELGLHSVVRWFTRFLEPNDPCGERIQGGPFHSFLGHESESRHLFKSVRCPSRGAGLRGERGLQRRDPNRGGPSAAKPEHSQALLQTVHVGNEIFQPALEGTGLDSTGAESRVELPIVDGLTSIVDRVRQQNQFVSRQLNRCLGLRQMITSVSAWRGGFWKSQMRSMDN